VKNQFDGQRQALRKISEARSRQLREGGPGSGRKARGYKPPPTPGEKEYQHAQKHRLDAWVPGGGGKETPFRSRQGRRLLYVYNHAKNQHRYLDLDTDTLMHTSFDPSKP
jgi:hypothetical protein